MKFHRHMSVFVQPGGERAVKTRRGLVKTSTRDGRVDDFKKTPRLKENTNREPFGECTNGKVNERSGSSACYVYVYNIVSYENVLTQHLCQTKSAIDDVTCALRFSS